MENLNSFNSNWSLTRWPRCPSVIRSINRKRYSPFLQSVRNHLSSTSKTNQVSEASETSRLHDRTTPKSRSETLTLQLCTVKVTGLSADTSQDLLRNYFENVRRSKGGPVSSVDIDLERQECIITFESPDGNFMLYILRAVYWNKVC